MGRAVLVHAAYIILHPYCIARRSKGASFGALLGSDSVNSIT